MFVRSMPICMEKGSSSFQAGHLEHIGKTEHCVIDHTDNRQLLGECRNQGIDDALHKQQMTSQMPNDMDVIP